MQITNFKNMSIAELQELVSMEGQLADELSRPHRGGDPRSSGSAVLEAACSRRNLKEERGAADKRCLGGPSTSPVSNGVRNPAASQSVVGFFSGRALAICHSPVIRHKHVLGRRH
jgi:hypothetical protein